MLIETRGGISKPQHHLFLIRSRSILITLFFLVLWFRMFIFLFPKKRLWSFSHFILRKQGYDLYTVYLATQGLLFRRDFHKYSLIQWNTSLFGGSGSRASLTVRITVHNGDNFGRFWPISDRLLSKKPILPYFFHSQRGRWINPFS